MNPAGLIYRVYQPVLFYLENVGPNYHCNRNSAIPRLISVSPDEAILLCQTG